MESRITEKRLRIAILSRQFIRHMGGAENYAVTLAEGMADKHEIHVFSQSALNTHTGIHVHVMPFSFTRPRWLNLLTYNAWTAWKTWRKFDIVHSHENIVHGNVQTIHVKPVTYNICTKKSFINWLRILSSPRLITYLTLEYFRFHTHSKRVLIATSDLLKELCIDTFKLPTNSINVLTPGVGFPSGTEKTHQEINSIRTHFDIPEKHYLLLMVGHNYAKKGLAVLLRALAILPKNISLIVVGDETQIPSWQSKASKLGVDKNVFFLGKQTDMSTIYQICNCLVHATLEDVFGMVALEAMAHQLPVIISPTPYCLSANLLTSGNEALILTNPHDENELVKYINELKDDPILTNKLKIGGLSFAKKYSWDGIIQKQIKIYKDLLGQ